MNEKRIVKVIDRSTWGTSYSYPLIRSIELRWVCPVCGEPRGEPRTVPFSEDGQYLSCDRWMNPCGHVDLYSDVIAEAERTA